LQLRFNRLLEKGENDLAIETGMELMEKVADTSTTAKRGCNWLMRLDGWRRGRRSRHARGKRKMRQQTKALRAALYARHSTNLQKDKSIDRQYADLEKAAERFGFKLDKRHYFEDRAHLIGAASRHEVDVVLVEATDRLSRDRADLF
jgi:hypothetical protein